MDAEWAGDPRTLPRDGTPAGLGATSLIFGILLPRSGKRLRAASQCAMSVCVRPPVRAHALKARLMLVALWCAELTRLGKAGGA